MGDWVEAVLSWSEYAKVPVKEVRKIRYVAPPSPQCMAVRYPFESAQLELVLTLLCRHCSCTLFRLCCALRSVDDHILPTYHLGALGMSGQTAYWGLFSVLNPSPGETVVISGAAGAVGSLVCQLAKIHGCKVVAIAGGENKGKWLKEEIGVDEVVDYKKDGFEKEFNDKVGYLNCYCTFPLIITSVHGNIYTADLCSTGFRYFATPRILPSSPAAPAPCSVDNVGGSILDLCLSRLNKGARIARKFPSFDLLNPVSDPRFFLKCRA